MTGTTEHVKNEVVPSKDPMALPRGIAATWVPQAPQTRSFRAGFAALQKRINHAKFVSKRLRAALASVDVEASLAKCQDTVAVAHGFAHWHELSSNVGRAQDGGPFEGVPAIVALGDAVARRHGLPGEATLALALGVMSREVAETVATGDGLGPALGRALSGTEWLVANQVDHDGAGLDRAACGAAFARQLGAPWTGVRGVARHVRCVAVACVVHAEGPYYGKPRVAEAFRKSMADAHAAVPAGKGRDHACEALLAPMMADPRLLARIDEAASGHAWTSTALVSLLGRARRSGGVLPTAEFIWLRDVDPELYRVLNSVGRSSHHVEASGAIAHYHEGCAAGGPLAQPRVMAAVDAMEAGHRGSGDF